MLGFLTADEIRFRTDLIKSRLELKKKEDGTMSIYRALTVPTQFAEANGIRFA
ncbi:MAG: hypothetical protein JWM11_7788 [Planctomycetaceae bacterium]|nr:hypothetical protein [Planctomycetaceae bacterium]